MKLWDNFKKKIAKEEIRNLSLDDFLLLANLSDDYMTVDKAMQISGVATGINLISNTVSMIPIKLYRENEDKRVEEIQDIRVDLLNIDTKDTFTGFELKSAMIRDYLLNGEINIYINKQRNEVKSLHYVNSQNVSVMSNADPIFKKYDLLVNGTKYRDFEFIRILRNSDDGLSGKGIIKENSKSLAIAYNTMLFENKQAKSGGIKRGFLQSDGPLKEEYIKQLKEDWKKMYGGDKETSTIVLNSGVKFQEATETSQEQQLNERKLSSFNDISKILNIPINLLDGKYSDDAYLNFVKIAVSPILEVIASGLNKYFLLEKEKDNMFWAFDDKDLLKGDTLKRYQAYKIALSAGFMQIDEVRYQENLPSLDFEYINIGLNSVLFNPKTKEIHIPNTGQTLDMKGGNNQILDNNKQLNNDDKKANPIDFEQ